MEGCKRDQEREKAEEGDQGPEQDSKIGTGSRKIPKLASASASAKTLSVLTIPLMTPSSCFGSSLNTFELPLQSYFSFKLLKVTANYRNETK